MQQSIIPTDVVKSKRDLHEFLDRLGIKLPPIKSPGCTVDYMKKTHTGEYWCPKYNELKVRSCYKPPSKDKVFTEVVMHLASANAAPFGFSDQSKIPAEWLIQCLSTLNPDHLFFQCDYYPDDFKGPRLMIQGDYGNQSRFVIPGKGPSTIIVSDEHVK